MSRASGPSVSMKKLNSIFKIPFRVLLSNQCHIKGHFSIEIDIKSSMGKLKVNFKFK